MYDLVYTRSSSSISGVGISEKQKLDFTNFLDSLAYLVIFNDARDASKSKKRKNEGRATCRKEEKQSENIMYTNCFLTQCFNLQCFEGIVQFVNAKSDSTASPVQH